jgi:hypothetical protein
VAHDLHAADEQPFEDQQPERAFGVGRSPARRRGRRRLQRRDLGDQVASCPGRLLLGETFGEVGIGVDDPTRSVIGIVSPSPRSSPAGPPLQTSIRRP